MRPREWRRIVLGILLACSCLAAPRVTAEDPDLARLRSFVLASPDAVGEAAVRQLLEANPRLANARDESGPILASAIDLIDQAGEPGRRGLLLAELLVAKGADVNALSRDGEPLLLAYAGLAQVPHIEFLIGHGAKADVRDRDGRSALHRVALLKEHEPDGTAVAAGRVERHLAAARVLVNAGGSVDARDKRGTTPLALTCFVGNRRMADALIAAGADVNNVDADGYSVLACVLARSEEGWANQDERATLAPVTELLRKHGARDVRPR